MDIGAVVSGFRLKGLAQIKKTYAYENGAPFQFTRSAFQGQGLSTRAWATGKSISSLFFYFI